VVASAPALDEECFVHSFERFPAPDFAVNLPLNIPSFFCRHTQLGRQFRWAGKAEIEGVNAVRALVPPVGRHAAHNLDRGLMIAVRRVMVIPGRVDLDSVVGGNACKGLDLHLR